MKTHDTDYDNLYAYKCINMSVDVLTLGRALSNMNMYSLHSALLTMPKPLTVWITTDSGKFVKKWEYQTT